MLVQINTIEDVELFAKSLVGEGSNFHPDDDFHGYVDLSTGEPSYTKEEAKERNKLMRQAFGVCAREDADIYSVMLRVLLKETGLEKYIPHP